MLSEVKLIKDGFFLSIVIPIYNEQNRIQGTLKKISDYYSKKDYYYELILVNDGSNDSTSEILRKYKEKLDGHSKNYTLRILNNKKNIGKGFSVRKGVLASKGKYVLFTDADLSTPIEEAEKLLFYLQNSYNISIGSRGLSDSKIIIRQNIIRQSMGKFFNFLVRKIMKLKYIDTQCGFKCFDRNTVDSIFPFLKVNDFSFDIEILFLAEKLQLKVKEVPICWLNSNDSKVRMIRSSFDMLLSLLKLKKIHKNF
jgi:dolichyl-phosphate beta-glucosyltransferase